jgi:hypothetical protein
MKFPVTLLTGLVAGCILCLLINWHSNVDTRKETTEPTKREYKVVDNSRLNVPAVPPRPAKPNSAAVTHPLSSGEASRRSAVNPVPDVRPLPESLRARTDLRGILLNRSYGTLIGGALNLTDNDSAERINKVIEASMKALAAREHGAAKLISQSNTDGVSIKHYSVPGNTEFLGSLRERLDKELAPHFPEADRALWLDSILKGNAFTSFDRDYTIVIQETNAGIRILAEGKGFYNPTSDGGHSETMKSVTFSSEAQTEIFESRWGMLIRK